MGLFFDSPEEKLTKSLFDLKMASKTLQRESKKCEKEEAKEKKLIKTCIEKNNLEGARIHAENSIRNHNQALQYRVVLDRCAKRGYLGTWASG